MLLEENFKIAFPVFWTESWIRIIRNSAKRANRTVLYWTRNRLITMRLIPRTELRRNITPDVVLLHVITRVWCYKFSYFFFFFLSFRVVTPWTFKLMCCYSAHAIFRVYNVPRGKIIQSEARITTTSFRVLILLLSF